MFTFSSLCGVVMVVVPRGVFEAVLAVPSSAFALVVDDVSKFNGDPPIPARPPGMKSAPPLHRRPLIDFIIHFSIHFNIHFDIILHLPPLTP